MAETNETQVIIAGRVLTLRGYETAEYTQKVANYINKKLDECKTTVSFRSQNKEMQMLLVALNIADDYMKIHEKLAEVETLIKDKDKEIYNLKHDIVTTQSRLDKADEQVRTLQDKMAESSKRLIQLDAKLRSKDKKSEAVKPQSESKPENRPEPKPEARPESKPEARTEAKPSTAPAAKTEPKSEVRPEVNKPEANKTEVRPESKPVAGSVSKPESKPENSSSPKPDLTRPLAPGPGPEVKPSVKPEAASEPAQAEVKSEAKPEQAKASFQTAPKPGPMYKQESLFPDDGVKPVSEPRLVKGDEDRKQDDPKAIQFPFNRK